MIEPLGREMLALLIARELRDGFVVNLGIGIPTLVSGFIPAGMRVIIHAENGFLGCGPLAEPGLEDADYINAGGQYITPVSEHCFVDSAVSFGLIRGGHIDLAIMGGLQVSAAGDLANWFRPERGIGSIGGAMDLATGAKRIIVAMEHTTKNGEPKIVERCQYPLTGKAVVNTIYTDLAILDVTSQGLLLREIAPGASPEEIQARTGAPLHWTPALKEMEF